MLLAVTDEIIARLPPQAIITAAVGSDRRLTTDEMNAAIDDLGIREQHAEVEDPGRLLQGTRDLVRVLVDDVDAHGGEDGQHRRQGDGRTDPRDLQSDLALTGIARLVDLQGELTRLEILDAHTEFF